MNPGRHFFDKFLFCVNTKLEKSRNNSQDSSDLSLEEQLFRATSAANNVCDSSSIRDESSEYSYDEIRDPYDYFQMVDTFRYFYPQRKDAFTCWNTKANARETNYGTRLDYIFCSQDLLQSLEDSFVLSDVEGSDHCPVSLLMCLTAVPADVPPQHCTKYFPEFQGQQQKLSNYFQKVSENDTVEFADESIYNNISSNSGAETMENTSSVRNSEGKKESMLNFLQFNNSKSNDITSIYSSKMNTISGKRKLDCSSKSNGKRSQKCLFSYFGTKTKEHEKLSLTSTDVSNISLYEAEMQYLKDNPDIYKMLGLAKDGTVNVEALNSNLSYTDCHTEILPHQPEHISQSSPAELSASKLDDTVLSSSPAKGLDQSDSNLNQESVSSVYLEGEQKKSWDFMKQKAVVPLCPGHKEPCVVRTTKKKGPNFNRRFYACSRGVGRPGQKEAQCNFFKWL